MLTMTVPDWIWYLLEDEEDGDTKAPVLDADRPENSIRPALRESLARIREALDGQVSGLVETENGLCFQGRFGRTHIVAFPRDYLCADGQLVRDTVRVVTEPGPALMIPPAAVARANELPGLSAVERSLSWRSLSVLSRVSNYAGWDRNLPLHESLIVAAALSHDTVLATAMNQALNLADAEAWPGTGLPGSGEPCRWGPADLRDVCTMLEVRKGIPDADSRALSVAFPWTGGPDKKWQPVGGCRLHFVLDQPHPLLGGGMFVRLELPVFRHRRYLAWAANWLNGVEVCATDAPPFFGAWSVAPDKDQLVFTTFWPNMLHRPGLALTITGWSLGRSRRARDWLEDELARADGSGESFGIVAPDDRP